MNGGDEVEAPVASPSGDTQHCWEGGSGALGKGRGAEAGSSVTSRPRWFLSEPVSATGMLTQSGEMSRKSNNNSYATEH